MVDELVPIELRTIISLIDDCCPFCIYVQQNNGCNLGVVGETTDDCFYFDFEKPKINETTSG